MTAKRRQRVSRLPLFILLSCLISLCAPTPLDDASSQAPGVRLVAAVGQAAPAKPTTKPALVRNATATTPRKNKGKENTKDEKKITLSPSGGDDEEEDGGNEEDEEAEEEKCKSLEECEECPGGTKSGGEGCEQTGRRKRFECTLSKGGETIKRFKKYKPCKRTVADEEFLMIRMQAICVLLGTLSLVSVRRQKVTNASLFDQRRRRAAAASGRGGGTNGNGGVDVRVGGAVRYTAVDQDENGGIASETASIGGSSHGTESPSVGSGKMSIEMV